MRTVLAIIIGLHLITVCAAADFKPFEGPKPMVIFIQSDPSADVIGADTPRVAIYENGDVIFTRKVNDRPVYHFVSLDKDGLEKVRERINPVLALKGVRLRYNIRPNVTDQPEAMFYLGDGDRVVVTSVYGLVAPDTRLPAETESPNGPQPTVPPDELLKLHKWLCEIDYPGSKEWTPKYVEVMLWDYSNAAEASVQWPKEWPSLNSDRAIRRGDAYSIFLDGSLLPEVRAVLATQTEMGALEIEGKKMAAFCRFTFPGEPVWRKALTAAAKRAKMAEGQGDKGRADPTSRPVGPDMTGGQTKGGQNQGGPSQGGQNQGGPSQGGQNQSGQ